MNYQGSLCFGEYMMVSGQNQILYMKINVLYICYMFSLNSKFTYQHYYKKNRKHNECVYRQQSYSTSHF